MATGNSKVAVSLNEHAFRGNVKEFNELASKLSKDKLADRETWQFNSTVVLTPLHICARADMIGENENRKITQLCVQVMEEWLEIVDSDGWLPLVIAANRNNVVFIEEVGKAINNRKIINKRQKFWHASPLYMASWHGHIKAVEALLKIGADPTVKFINHKNAWTTAVHVAAVNGQIEVLRCFFDCNTELVNLDGGDGDRPIHAASGFASENQLKAIEMLVKEFSADVNCRGYFGRTPAHVAAEFGNFEAFTTLENLGCDLNLTDNQDNTVAHVAVLLNQVEFIEKLVKKHAFLLKSKGFSGETPIQCAERLHKQRFKGRDYSALIAFLTPLL